MMSDWENFLCERGLISSAYFFFFFFDRYIPIFCVSSVR